MGTSWSLALAGDRQAGGSDDARERVRATLRQVVAESSLWEGGSEISRFNRAAAGTRQPLSEGFRTVVEAALHLAEASEGAFDPTLGALSEHWGFGPAGERPFPTETAPHAAGRWRELRLTDGALLQPGGVRLDLNGIAKGQAVDRVAESLLEAGHRHFLIGIGGEYRGEGVRPDGQPWWVDVEQPPGSAFPPLRLALAGLAVATSGDYRRAQFHGGRRFSHSLDPATGRPIENRVASVAVLGASAMIADAEATAITVLGPDKGLRWASGRGLAAHLILREESGFRERLTPALTAMLG
ncbi:FAD:protein FMN transferase [Sandaracinobacter sp. RS1-74]|uniref:FAD:protein FMN transferase n=1 Tax=Sandaracinobacteroides sayramensis TaxID=2913411 RepID=UPI001EDB533D|nr:FAD:protein FMN transferase [Sandaracinobacteroides sayramensis]MCG2842463.1 FAD:protein FMN transferase [Sandaracinobacteroides sayramensis]